MQVGPGDRSAPANLRLEKGTCIVCGKETKGTPATPDTVLRIARLARSALGKPHHTIACRGHLAEAQAKSAKFGKRVFSYRLGAAIIFLLLMAGQAAFGQPLLPIIFPAVSAALFIATLPYFAYFPKFCQQTP
jgi:hypothetical protein